MSHKSVLFILNSLAGGGAEKVIVNIANGFKEAGIEVTMLLARKEGVYFDILHPQIEVSIIGTSSFLGLLKRLPAFLKSKQYTHVFTASDYISAATVLSKKRVRGDFKIIATLHYHLLYELSSLPLANKLWLGFINKYITSKADKIVGVSKGVAEGFMKNAQNNRLPISTIYNPVVDASTAILANKEIEDTFLNLPYIITVGRLAAQKNQKILLDAFSFISAKCPDMHLLVLGAGDKEADLKKQSHTLKLNEKIHFLGFQANPFKYVQRAKLFVLTSDCEGLGNVIIEALALGVNVVSTDCPSGPREILDGNTYGWLSKVNDAEDLAEKIELALRNPKDETFLKQRSLIFRNDTSVRQYLQLLNE